MAMIYITRLRLRSMRFVVPLLWNNWRSIRQLRQSSGFLVGGIARDSGGGRWTITLWRDTASALGYRNSGAHLRSMPKLEHWCSEASVAHWEQDEIGLPAPREILERMRAIGRTSKVRNPSARQDAGYTASDSAPTVIMKLKPALAPAPQPAI